MDNYLGRVTKPRILAAVREAKGEQSAQLIDHLKKAEMAKEAERLREGTNQPSNFRLFVIVRSSPSAPVRDCWPPSSSTRLGNLAVVQHPKMIWPGKSAA